MKDYREWQESPGEAFKRLREIFAGAQKPFQVLTEAELRKALFEPVFKVLGFRAEEGKSPTDDSQVPDYRLYSDGSEKPIAVCLTYPWHRFLDGKDYKRDTATPEENPGASVVSILEKGEVPWAIVTNGKTWRLYSKKTHSRATNYYEIDLDEALCLESSHEADPGESFRYFLLFFRRQAFELQKRTREGKELELSFLDKLLDESADYAKRLGERLKERVFDEIFPFLGKGFIEFIRQREGKSTELTDQRLKEIFQGTLTLLYRLLFLFYAEARGLLPVREIRGYWEKSLTKLKREIADVAGKIEDERDGKLDKRFGVEEYSLYDHLSGLFKIIDEGEASVNVPTYNGGLFITNPLPDDDSDEMVHARFLADYKIPDRFLSQALDRLARDVDEKRHDLVMIDYKSLGVRQLGSIYEGLLEFKLRIAPAKMAFVKAKNKDLIVPYSEAAKKKMSIVKDGRGKNATEKILPKGAVYLENDKRERKATGSYYTPDYIVKYIVENAVGPVVEEKFKSIAPKFREVEKRKKEFDKRQEALKERGLQPEPPEKRDLIGKELIDEFLDIKVLDPAMGSGHFLVETVDFITDKALDFLNGFSRDNPVFTYLDRMRDEIKREMDEQNVVIDENRLTQINLLKRNVLKRCVYGVDINPMAVELAKVSLWLDCFTLGAPLSFLDHHLRCGNSLIGVKVEEVQKAVKHQSLLLFHDPFKKLTHAIDLMREIGRLSDVTRSQVENSRSKYGAASAEMKPFKRILDVYTSQWFGNGVPETKRRGDKIISQVPLAIQLLLDIRAENLFKARTDGEISDSLELLNEDDRAVFLRSSETAITHRFFHWELEFPEVFYGRRSDASQFTEKLEEGGFDAVVGNPPYLNVIELDPITRQYLLNSYSYACGRVDIYLPFIEKSLSILNNNGYSCLITPNKWYVYSYGFPLRNDLLSGKYQWISAVDLSLSQSVFEESDTYSQISVFKSHTTEDSATPINVYRFLKDEPSKILNLNDAANSGIVLHNRNSTSDFQLLPEQVFSPRLSKLALNLYSRLVDSNSIIGEYFDIEQLIRIGSSHKRKKLIFHRPMHSLPREARKVIDADELRKWIIEWDGRHLIYKPKELYNPKTPEIFEQPKIFIKDTSPSLQVVPDLGDDRSPEGLRWFYALNTVYGLIPKKRYETQFIAYVSACLNSKLGDFLYKLLFGALTISGGYIRFREYIKHLPLIHTEPAQLGKGNTNAAMRENNIAVLAKNILSISSAKLRAENMFAIKIAQVILNKDNADTIYTFKGINKILKPFSGLDDDANIHVKEGVIKCIKTNQNKLDITLNNDIIKRIESECNLLDIQYAKLRSDYKDKTEALDNAIYEYYEINNDEVEMIEKELSYA